jgi:hypothetical protein
MPSGRSLSFAFGNVDARTELDENALAVVLPEVPAQKHLRAVSDSKCLFSHAVDSRQCVLLIGEHMLNGSAYPLLSTNQPIQVVELMSSRDALLPSEAALGFDDIGHTS